MVVGYPKAAISVRVSCKFHILKQLILFVLWCIEISSGGRCQNVKIIRSIDSHQVDRIRLPKQLCGVTSAEDMGCGVMKKRKINSCSCTCNKTNSVGTSYVKTTVGYHNGSWQCLNNSQVRQYAGCNLLSTGEVVTDPILDISRKPYVLKIPGQTCRVNGIQSAYLRCDGTWKLLRERILRRFINTSMIFTENQVAIEYIGASETHRTINGRIIRLAVQCRKQRRNRDSGCIVMKVKGKMRCPLSFATRNPRESGAKVNNANLIWKPVSPPLLKQLHRPKMESSKSNVEKQKGIDTTVVISWTVIIGAFVVVVLVLVTVLILAAMVMKRREKRRVIVSDNLVEGLGIFGAS